MNFDPTPLWLISREDFDNYSKRMVDWTKARLADKPTSLMPALAIITRTPGKDANGNVQAGDDETTIVMLATDFNEPDEKHRALFQIGQTFWNKQAIPTAIFMATEAWVAAETDLPPGVQPRDAATKREAIVILGMSIGRKHQAVSIVPVNRINGRIETDTSQVKWEKARTQLLDHFYLGFFDHLRTKGVSHP